MPKAKSTEFTAAETPEEPTTPVPLTKELESKKTELEDLDKQIAELQAKRKSVDSFLTTFEGPISESEKVKKEYGDAYPKLTTDLDALKQSIEQRKKEVEAILGDNAKKFRDRIAEVDRKIADDRSNADNLAAEALKADQSVQAAKNELKVAEDTLASLKQTLAKTNTKLKELASMKARENKTDSDKAYGTKALLVKDLEDALSSLTLLKPEELNTKLEDSIVAVKKATETLAEATSTAAAKKKAADEARKLADSSKASRTADILKATADIQ